MTEATIDLERDYYAFKTSAVELYTCPACGDHRLQYGFVHCPGCGARVVWEAK